ncbi:PEP-CTERM sorting domain-containing protein [Methyloversatilis thermotolerans]|uniref:PEP-CTERM sorting domain-containing protein n=1 Tax=Methyloversatilis thermotolerans TaxID=1346290 RepID=UPI0003799998|nr:PEP-CTERM sorting domain-containing protein [Methyloversatilis thermotolerans]
MFRHTALALVLASLGFSAHAALSAGDIALTSFNADEDGLSFVALADIDANTTIYFSDNEWNGSAFNTGESYNQWSSGSSVIAAGTVVRLSAYDKTSLSASVGTLSRVSVSGSSNWGIANSNETVYAYLGTSATAPTSFLAAITNGSFTADGSLTGTGLSEGESAIRLNAYATSASPDYAEYTGPRTGLTADAYRALLADAKNWTVDTANGSYASTVPDTTNFQIAVVPEPETYALLLAGLGLIGVAARRRG